MGISDMIGGKQTPESYNPLDKSTDFMNLRKLPSMEARHGVEHERGIDHLIQGLVELLPKRGGTWPLHDRAKWLRLAAGIFDLGYKTDDAEHAEISISVVQDEANRPASRSTAKTQGMMRPDT
jgi:hypothetical protein